MDGRADPDVEAISTGRGTSAGREAAASARESVASMVFAAGTGSRVERPRTRNAAIAIACTTMMTTSARTRSGIDNRRGPVEECGGGAT